MTRSARRLLAAALVLLLVPVLIAGCGAQVRGATQQAAAVAATMPQPQPARLSASSGAWTTRTGVCTESLGSAADYGRVFASITNDTWAGADGAGTVALADGRTLWFFGDTFQGAEGADGGYTADTRMVGNSILVQSGGCIEGFAGNAGRPALPRAGATKTWPTAGVTDGDRTYLFAQRIRVAGDGAFDFRILGTAIIPLEVTATDVVAGEPVRSPSYDAVATDVLWGAAVLNRTDALYVYGTRKSADPWVFGKSVYVARVPHGALTRLRDWTYWDGHRWSRSQARATSVIDGVGGPSSTFSVVASATGVEIVAKREEALGKDVATWAAPAPRGPFAPPESRKRAASTGGELRYLAYAHPELALGSGKLLLTVSRNNTDLRAVLRDAAYYRPLFYELAP